MYEYRECAQTDVDAAVVLVVFVVRIILSCIYWSDNSVSISLPACLAWYVSAFEMHCCSHTWLHISVPVMAVYHCVCCGQSKVPVEWFHVVEVTVEWFQFTCMMFVHHWSVECGSVRDKLTYCTWCWYWLFLTVLDAGTGCVWVKNSSH